MRRKFSPNSLQAWTRYATANSTFPGGRSMALLSTAIAACGLLAGCTQTTSDDEKQWHLSRFNGLRQLELQKPDKALEFFRKEYADAKRIGPHSTRLIISLKDLTGCYKLLAPKDPGGSPAQPADLSSLQNEANDFSKNVPPGDSDAERFLLRLELAETYSNLGSLYENDHRYRDAADSFNKSVSLLLDLLPAHGINKLVGMHLAESAYGAAQCYQVLGQINQARSIYQRIVANHVIQNFPDGWSRSIVSAAKQAGVYSEKTKDVIESETGLNAKVSENDPESKWYRIYEESKDAFKARDFSEAERKAGEALAAARLIPGGESQVARTESDLGELYTIQRQCDQAEKLLLHAYAVQSKNNEIDTRLSTCKRLALNYFRMKQPAKGLPFAQALVAGLAKRGSNNMTSDPTEMAYAYATLADCEKGAGNIEQAERDYNTALSLPHDKFLEGKVFTDLGELMSSNRPQQAMKMYQAAQARFANDDSDRGKFFSVRLANDITALSVKAGK